MGNVYILRSGNENLFKIGRTQGSPADRAKQLATGNPHPLSVFDAIETEFPNECEAYLHGRLRAKRSKRSDAREFFEIDPAELKEEISAAREFLQNDVPKFEQAKQLATEVSEERLIRPSAIELELYQRLLYVTADHKMLTLSKQRLETELKLVIGKAAGLEGLAMWKSSTMRRFDLAKFKISEPALYGSYVVPRHQRSFRLL